MSTKNICSTTVRRLISDIKQISLNPLTKEGIYYKHDETNMLAGYALILGPNETPYEHGNFLFRFIFPEDYPHSPPKVLYCTNDGITRFNPNLYKNGKVCISLLNTWKGEGWTGCQTISSILLVLCSLLNDNPLLNEPGVGSNHRDIPSYNKIVKYKTIETAISRVLDKNDLQDEFHQFYDDIVANFLNNYENIINSIKGKENEILTCGMYNITIKTQYKSVRLKLAQHYNNLKTSNNLKNILESREKNVVLIE